MLLLVVFSSDTVLTTTGGRVAHSGVGKTSPMTESEANINEKTFNLLISLVCILKKQNNTRSLMYSNNL